MELLLRRRMVSLQDSHLTLTASAHDWRRARSAAEAAVRHSLRGCERVVLVSDVLRQAEEQFSLKLSTHMAATVLREQIAEHRGLKTDVTDY
ncbi:hypothetical protein [Streptomyces sp. NPDC058394]|uniref:hypothetical protein n=1 Tax=Streptomyces sp. NPDC058394 TaxID=3346477 RepID=UPI003658E57C